MSEATSVITFEKWDSRNLSIKFWYYGMPNTDMRALPLGRHAKNLEKADLSLVTISHFPNIDVILYLLSQVLLILVLLNTTFKLSILHISILFKIQWHVLPDSNSVQTTSCIVVSSCHCLLCNSYVVGGAWNICKGFRLQNICCILFLVWTVCLLQ